ncbi:hypothetical protein ABE957_04740 [Halomonas sp. CS7]|uniref:Uncharacterized protein n=1 Tax=Halomonas pelophila TaxID=3151122 RepID=A0ABV1N3L7_9GAMM
MRIIGLLLALILLGYVMKTYLDSAVSPGDSGETLSHPQGTIERAERAAQRINQTLEERQRHLEASGG